MHNIFDSIYIKDHELLFYIYIASMIIIMVVTLIFVIKELKKNEDK